MWMALSRLPLLLCKILGSHSLSFPSSPSSASGLCDDRDWILTCLCVPRVKHTVWCSINARGWNCKGVIDLSKNHWASNNQHCSSVRRTSVPSLIVGLLLLASVLYSRVCIPASLWIFVGQKWIFVTVLISIKQEYVSVVWKGMDSSCKMGTYSIFGCACHK